MFVGREHDMIRTLPSSTSGKPQDKAISMQIIKNEWAWTYQIWGNLVGYRIHYALYQNAGPNIADAMDRHLASPHPVVI